MNTTSHLLMIRPVQFNYNAQTAVNNAFQVISEQEDVQEKALKEFDDFVQLLRTNSIDVLVINDTAEPHTPDSIFPNNWISFHSDGSIVLYPMYAENRRQERKPEVLAQIQKEFGIKQVIDLSTFENEGKYLEGTGSMVLDRDKNIAYACLSPRTDEDMLDKFCEDMQYHAVAFTATDSKGTAIYHTNVMMCVADKYVVICLYCIDNETEQKLVMQTIHHSGKEIIEISMEQMNQFAGNMLQVHNEDGKKILVMSSQAYYSLTVDQIEKLEFYNAIIHSPLNTIEQNGGGSARCMMAEIFLPKNLI